jgi:uncharacterized C2H2 Zn-finger protein
MRRDDSAMRGDGADPLRCERCGRHFPTQPALEEHWAAAHETAGKRVRCAECDTEFETEGELSKHVREQH